MRQKRGRSSRPEDHHFLTLDQLLFPPDRFCLLGFFRDRVYDNVQNASLNGEGVHFNTADLPSFLAWPSTVKHLKSWK